MNFYDFLWCIFYELNKNSLFEIEENQCLAGMFREIIRLSIPTLPILSFIRYVSLKNCSSYSHKAKIISYIYIYKLIHYKLIYINIYI